MSILSKMKLSDQTRAQAIASPIVRKRNKLLESIEHQIHAVEAEDKGELYTYQSLRFVTQPETKERARQLVSVKVRPWWWRDMADTYFLTLKYGNKKLELAKGKYAIEVGAKENLLPTFRRLEEAVRAGELDGVISQVAKFAK